MRCFAIILQSEERKVPTSGTGEKEVLYIGSYGLTRWESMSKLKTRIR
jgi:hypothetical protein